MTDDIRKLIERLTPEPVCDDCIAERLQIGDPQAVSITTNELAGSNRFERRRDVCTLCDVERLTTRRSV
jgi:hypothetical protein